MRILVACEFSGTVRDAFIRRGHDAISCDLLDSEKPGPHYKGDVRDILNDDFDLMIAHPPCQYLATVGAWRFDKVQNEQAAALDFVRLLMDAPIAKICIENPVSIISSKIKPSSQRIQPYEFGHPCTKRTCLWLKNLPQLIPTRIVKPTESFIKSKGSTGTARGSDRSRTFEGIAEAMADQWVSENTEDDGNGGDFI